MSFRQLSVTSRSNFSECTAEPHHVFSQLHFANRDKLTNSTMVCKKENFRFKMHSRFFLFPLHRRVQRQMNKNIWQDVILFKCLFVITKVAVIAKNDFVMVKKSLETLPA